MPPYLQRLSNELGHFAVLRVLVSADDKLDNAGSVPEDRGGVGLSDPDQRFTVDFDDLVVDLKQNRLTG